MLKLLIAVIAAGLVGVLMAKQDSQNAGDIPITDISAVDRIATAIAAAEGFSIPGSRPGRNHNPGDLTVDTTGKGVGRDGIFIVYATDSDGWDALRQQVQLMLNNTSKVYNNGMTIADVAARYTTTDQAAWAAIVARELGVTQDTTLAEI
jgi:hypothetical protein